MGRFSKGPRHGGWTSVIVIAASLALIAAGVTLHFKQGKFTPDVVGAEIAAPVAGPQDRLSARFSICSNGKRQNCVVDGDTFWFGGEKIRVLDINTPEISTPRCDREFALGQQAAERFRELLNAGPFSLANGDEETDRYGRKLRRVIRGGRSLGDILVDEGLAEDWQGYRRNWC